MSPAPCRELRSSQVSSTTFADHLGAQVLQAGPNTIGSNARPVLPQQVPRCSLDEIEAPIGHKQGLKHPECRPQRCQQVRVKDYAIVRVQDALNKCVDVAVMRPLPHSPEDIEECCSGHPSVDPVSSAGRQALSLRATTPQPRQFLIAKRLHLSLARRSQQPAEDRPLSLGSRFSKLLVIRERCVVRQSNERIGVVVTRGAHHAPRRRKEAPPTEIGHHVQGSPMSAGDVQTRSKQGRSHDVVDGVVRVRQRSGKHVGKHLGSQPSGEPNLHFE